MENEILDDERLLDSGLLTDVTVICGDKEFKAHKVILCARNLWFRKCLMGSFEESKTGVVNIEGFEPRYVDWIIRRIYNPKLSPERLESQNESECIFQKYFDLIRAADYFIIPNATNAAAFLLKAIAKSWFAMENLIKFPAKVMTQIRSAVQTVYENPQTNLSGSFRLVLVKHAFKSRIFLYHKPEFLELLQEWPLFALDLFQSSLSSNEWDYGRTPLQREPRCAGCGERVAPLEGNVQPPVEGNVQPPFYGGQIHSKPIGELTVESIRIASWCKRCSDGRDFAKQAGLWKGSTKI